MAWVCEAFSSGCECAWGRDRWAAMGVGRRGITIGRLDDEDLELVVFLFVNVFFLLLGSGGVFSEIRIGPWRRGWLHLEGGG